MTDDDDVVERVRQEPDPIRRARLAGELINTYQQRSVELARLRKEAINAAAETGLRSRPARPDPRSYQPDPPFGAAG